MDLKTSITKDMIQTPYTKMREEYEKIDRFILHVKASCHQTELPEENPLWHWLRFDVVKSLESCQSMMLHYLDLHDYQKFLEFEIGYVLPIVEKVIGAMQRIPTSMVGTPEYFLIKNVSDKAKLVYVDLKEKK